MEGYIRKRGNRYYFSFEVAGVGGKRKRIERAGGRTKKEAEAALRAALTEYRNTGSMFEPTKMSFADYLDYWYQNYVQVNLAVNTQLAYKNIIEKHLKPALGSYFLHDLSPATLQEFVNHKYLSGISKNHLTNILAVLTGSLKAATNLSFSTMIVVKVSAECVLFTSTDILTGPLQEQQPASFICAVLTTEMLLRLSLGVRLRSR